MLVFLWTTTSRVLVVLLGFFFGFFLVVAVYKIFTPAISFSSELNRKCSGKQ